MRSRPPAFPWPLVLVLTALAAAGLSLLVGDSLRFDPSGWLRWGHELAFAPDRFSTAEYPSWKPLPVLITVPLASTGSLAPMLWLVLARAAGFLALALVFQLAWRSGGQVAAVVAVVALALVPAWWPTLLGGGIEPALVALGAAAVQRHQVGHRLQALALGALVALGREEALVVLVLYGLWLGREDRRWVAVAGGLALLVAGLWLGGDWLGSGDPLHGGELARTASGSAAGTASGLLVVPFWIAMAAGVAAPGAPARWFAALGLLWVAVDVALAMAGFPLEPRFLFPAAASLSVAAGVGVAAMRRRLLPGAARRVQP